MGGYRQLFINVLMPLSVSPVLIDGNSRDSKYVISGVYRDNINMVRNIVLTQCFRLPNVEFKNFFYLINTDSNNRNCTFVLVDESYKINEIWDEILSPYYWFTNYEI